jgi:hypothetical protein
MRAAICLLFPRTDEPDADALEFSLEFFLQMANAMVDHSADIERYVRVAFESP